MLWPCLCFLIMVCRRVQCWAQCCFCCTPLIMWSWFIVLVCWPMPMLMICRYIVTWMLVLNRLCCNDSEIVLILLVDGCPRINSSLTLSLTRICVNFSTVYNDTLVAKGLTHQKWNWFGFTVVVGNLALLRMTLSFFSDSNMTMSQHVLRVCQNCYFQNSVDPFASADANMRQYFHCLHWYAGSKRVNPSIREGLVCRIKTSLGSCFGPVSWITVIVFLCVCLCLLSSSYSLCWILLLVWFLAWSALICPCLSCWLLH